MHTHYWGVLAGWHSVGLFAIPPTLQGGLYAGRHEWEERVECSRILSALTPPILAWYTNLVISDYWGATAVFHMAALEFNIYALMRFLVVTEHSAVGYNSHDPCKGHGGCGTNNPFWRDVQRRVDHYGFNQFVAEGFFDPAAAYPWYRRSAEIEWSSLRPSDCWFLYTFYDGRFH